jgi:two-component system chemotaxis response regulator CheY
MKVLIAEDDFTCRKLMQRLLAPFGESDIAEGERYDLVCLDIMMPEMDGQTVLKEIRKIEEESGLGGLDGVKILMTTALNDPKNIMQAFNSQCEGYLVKPIDRAKLITLLHDFGFSEEKKE